MARGRVREYPWNQRITVFVYLSDACAPMRARIVGPLKIVAERGAGAGARQNSAQRGARASLWNIGAYYICNNNIIYVQLQANKGSKMDNMSQ